MKTIIKRPLAFFLALIMALTMFVGTELTASAALTSSEVFNKAKQYTVEIHVAGYDIFGNYHAGLGSGFFISPDGNIVTNYHVIEDASSITVIDCNDKKYICNNVVAYDAYKDLAIISVETANHPYAEISYDYNTGDRIYTLGSSEGLTYTFSDGTISTKDRKFAEYGDDMTFIQISAPTSQGNSGGPLVDENGRAIGVNAFGLIDGQNINFAIPLSDLKTVTHYNYSLNEYERYCASAYNTFLATVVEEGIYDDDNDWHMIYTPESYYDGSTIEGGFFYDWNNDALGLYYNKTAASGIETYLELWLYPENKYPAELLGVYNDLEESVGVANINPVNYSSGETLPFNYKYHYPREGAVTGIYSETFVDALKYWENNLKDYGISVGDFGFTKAYTPKLDASKKFTLTLNPKGGSVYSETVIVGKGRPTVLTTPTRAGYRCLGWSTSSSATTATYKCGASYTPTKNTTLYAVWAKNTYNIAYELNGGTNNSGNPSTYSVSDASITLKNPTRKGYTFKGWYSDKNLTKPVSIIPSGSTGNKTFYTGWQANNYTITFNKNGGKTGSTKAIKATYNKAVTLSANGFTRAGYTFNGWNTRADGKGTAFTDKQSVKNLTATANGTVILYAQWKAKSYKITYKLNGGKNNSSNPKTYKTTKAITLKNPTRKGYTFKGWYSDKNLTKKVTKIKKGSTGNKTLYAKWRRK